MLAESGQKFPVGSFVDSTLICLDFKYTSKSFSAPSLTTDSKSRPVVFFIAGSRPITTEYSHVFSFKNVAPGSRLVQLTTKAFGFPLHVSSQGSSTLSCSGSQTDISIIEIDSGPAAPASTTPSPSESIQPETLSDKLKKSHHQVRVSGVTRRSSLCTSSSMSYRSSSDISP